MDSDPTSEAETHREASLLQPPLLCKISTLVLRFRRLPLPLHSPNSDDQPSSSFRRPVLIVPSFPLLSSSSTTSLKLYPNSLLSVSSHLKIEDQRHWMGTRRCVFVKGLNLRPDRASDASQFSCHIGLGRGGKISMTKAVSAAQEVVRCLLPRRVRLNPSKAEGVRVTIGVNPPHVHTWARDQVLLPSVAKIVDLKSEGRKRESEGKWFVYDNNSDDAITEAIEELELEDYNVSRHVWPWIKTQEAGFSHCALRARDECNWVAFMDVDEFFYFPFRRSRKLRFPSQKSLRNLLANFSSTPKIAEISDGLPQFWAIRFNFTPCSGSHGGVHMPPSEPREAQINCTPQRPRRYPSQCSASLSVEEGFSVSKFASEHGSVINHYKYQVWESFRAKFFRRVATYVADWQENQNEGSRDRAPGLGTEAIEPHNWHLQFCEVWDTGLRDFVLANLADRTTGLLPWERTFL
ncbi:glycosyltransferase family protein [Actinidia rufa]|uniref:Glycosyltransferase family 92 protein n=1 Tax=Actinidia rufa TaxID=165716 RepID=A0A7J0FNX9_9ERIC|nr:glycosyltransferase family protein [Actinidia rufa]